jgi:endonuclease YncB( thermonuclease family)
MTQLVLAVACLISADSITGKVVKVTDGDTITVLVEQRQVKVRLSAIDAPERKQDYSQKSTDALADLVFGKEVRIVSQGNDRYGRTIGDVFVGQMNVNEKLVEDGWAWNFFKYSQSQRLVELEREARDAKRGLWAGPSPVAPWEYRAEEARKRAEKRKVKATG